MYSIKNLIFIVFFLNYQIRGDVLHQKKKKIEFFFYF